MTFHTPVPTPSSAYHRKRSVRTDTSPSFLRTAPPPSTPLTVPHRSKLSTAHPSAAKSFRPSSYSSSPTPAAAQRHQRPHVLLAKAAQAGSLAFSTPPVAVVVLLLAFGSPSWPSTTSLSPPSSSIAFLQTFLRILAILQTFLLLVPFHAATLSTFCTTRRIPLRASIRRKDPPIHIPFARPSALRHTAALSLAGALQAPAFAVLIHGFPIAAAPTSQLFLCVIAGWTSGIAYSVLFFATNANILTLSLDRAPLRSRALERLRAALRPSTAALVIAAATAAVFLIGAPVDKPSPTSAAAVAAAAIEGAASLALDFTTLKSFFIVVEAVALCVATWTLSAVFVSVLLSQPYDFVLESQPLSTPSTPSRHFAPNPAILDNLILALTAANRADDPTGILRSLALQDLCDSVTSTPASRAPIFADPAGETWGHILAACLTPVDKLSYKLWLRSATTQRPALLNPSANAADNAFMSVDDVVLFGDVQSILHATAALANVVVASRDARSNEDTYGVAQRSLPDVVTSLVQCHSSCRAFREGERVLFAENAPKSELFWPFNEVERAAARRKNEDDEGEIRAAALIEFALARALGDIVAVFYDHLCGYVVGREPRWDPKFSAGLSVFLKDLGQFS